MTGLVVRPATNDDELTDMPTGIDNKIGLFQSDIVIDPDADAEIGTNVITGTLYHFHVHGYYSSADYALILHAEYVGDEDVDVSVSTHSPYFGGDDNVDPDPSNSNAFVITTVPEAKDSQTVTVVAKKDDVVLETKTWSLSGLDLVNNRLKLEPANSTDTICEMQTTDYTVGDQIPASYFQSDIHIDEATNAITGTLYGYKVTNNSSRVDYTLALRASYDDYDSVEALVATKRNDGSVYAWNPAELPNTPGVFWIDITPDTKDTTVVMVEAVYEVDGEPVTIDIGEYDLSGLTLTTRESGG